jgi:predicted DsbA family dithiol-disulfide isomerase
MGVPLVIDVVSDVVCPWCFIGKRRLDAAIEGQLDIEVRYHPYRLDPTLPVEGVDRAEYMRAKFGDRAPIGEMHHKLVEAGAEIGINFKFEQISRSPNTLDCHRLILWADSAGVQAQVVEELFSRYFEQGQDVSRPEVLADIASNCGLDPEQVLTLLEGDEDRDLIVSEDERARRMGIEGVPCYIVGGRYALMGAQEPSVLRQVFDRVREESGLLGNERQASR